MPEASARRHAPTTGGKASGASRKGQPPGAAAHGLTGNWGLPPRRSRQSTSRSSKFRTVGATRRVRQKGQAQRPPPRARRTRARGRGYLHKGTSRNGGTAPRPRACTARTTPTPEEQEVEAEAAMPARRRLGARQKLGSKGRGTRAGGGRRRTAPAPALTPAARAGGRRGGGRRGVGRGRRRSLIPPTHKRGQHARPNREAREGSISGRDLGDGRERAHRDHRRPRAVHSAGNEAQTTTEHVEKLNEVHLRFAENEVEAGRGRGQRTSRGWKLGRGRAQVAGSTAPRGRSLGGTVIRGPFLQLCCKTAARVALAAVVPRASPSCGVVCYNRR